MPLTSGIIAALALLAGPERLLLCRPVVAGDRALARADAVAEAGRRLPGVVLDYGVACESAGEAARAAGRAALGHGLFTSAEGRLDGSAYVVVLVSAGEAELARRALLVPTGADPVGPLQSALRELERDVPRPPSRWTQPAGWALIGTGLAAVAAGAVLAAQARDQARQADAASSPADYLAAEQAWRSRRAWGTAAFAAGGAALAAGLTLKLAF